MRFSKVRSTRNGQVVEMGGPRKVIMELFRRVTVNFSFIHAAFMILCAGFMFRNNTTYPKCYEK